jgi:hypothetical protein
MPKPPPPPVAIWEGFPSGERLAALLRVRAEQLGVAAQVKVMAWAVPGAFGVFVSWGTDPEMDGAGYEVADWSDGVRVLETANVVALDEALDYLSLRVSGLPRQGALDQLIPPRPSVWSRLRRRFSE